VNALLKLEDPLNAGFPILRKVIQLALGVLFVFGFSFFLNVNLIATSFASTRTNLELVQTSTKNESGKTGAKTGTEKAAKKTVKKTAKKKKAGGGSKANKAQASKAAVVPQAECPKTADVAEIKRLIFELKSAIKK
jgi:hypothetical protein